MTNQNAHTSKRAIIVATCVFAIILVIFGKLIYTSISEGGNLRDQAENYTIQKMTIEAQRGNIFSADGKLLAISMPVYNLYMDPTAPNNENFNNNIEALALELSEIFNNRTSLEWKNFIKAKRARGDRYIKIASQITFSDLQKVKTFPLYELGKYKGGLIVEQQNHRKMPLELIAKRTIGYDKQSSQAGIEGAFSSYLEGKNGEQWRQKIANGNWRPIESGYEIQPKNGSDVITTIDTRIQDVAHEELMNTMQKFEADHGCVIVMEVATGHVKAIANLGINEQGEYKELRNYAVYEKAEPGSTFKLTSFMVALDDGVIDTADIVDTDGGVYTIYGKKVKDSHKGGYGVISVAEAFRKSSNTGTVKAIYPHYKDNPEKFVDQLYKMGLNQKLGLEIKGEGTPNIPKPGDNNWYGTTLPWMTFGYGVELTPLQTLSIYNAVANDGKMIKPLFVSHIRENGRVIENFETKILNPAICSKETLAELQVLLEGVVERGTAKNIYSNDIRMAGKTGTSLLNYWKSTKEYQASFAGYFPSEAPKYSCIVVINNPNIYKGYYGNVVAAPIFKAIAEEIYLMTPKEEMHLDMTKEIAHSKDPTKIEDALSKNYIPNLRGYNGNEAIQILENAGFKVETTGNGKVKSQHPKHGTARNTTSVIKLTLG